MRAYVRACLRAGVCVCVRGDIRACVRVGGRQADGGGAMWTVGYVYLFNKTLRVLSHTATTKYQIGALKSLIIIVSRELIFVKVTNLLASSVRCPCAR